MLVIQVGNGTYAIPLGLSLAQQIAQLEDAAPRGKLVAFLDPYLFLLSVAYRV